MKDTGLFMLILLTVMWGYLVSSHGMLFPPASTANMTWTYVLDLPFKGYWQAFDLDLDAISVCQEVPSGTLEDGECKMDSFQATQYGHYMSSVLLALYLMFINVLLMNLLIAKFNNTFTEVYRQAKLHQSWQKCQLVLEYYVHTPAPFSILSFLLGSVLGSVGLCCCFCSRIFCGEEEDDTSDGYCGSSNVSEDHNRSSIEMNEESRAGNSTMDDAEGINVEMKDSDVSEFESGQMKKALGRSEADGTAQAGVQRQLDMLRRQQGQLQQQMDEMLYKLEQVLHKTTTHPPPPPASPPVKPIRDHVSLGTNGSDA